MNRLYPAREGSDIPFWMDTLCVPHAMTLKKMSIAKMKSTYETASKVLVPDASLLQTPVSSKPSEMYVSENHYVQMAIPTVDITRGE